MTKKKVPAGGAGVASTALQKPQTAAKPESTPEPAAAPELAPGEVPAKAMGWSWAAFLWGPIWAIGNKVWSGLLILLPVIGVIFLIILAIKGKKKSWEKGNWKDIDHFVKVQKRWVKIWLILFLINILVSVGVVVLGGAAAISGFRKGIESGAIEISTGDMDAAPSLDLGTE